jgi:hypothetical protein
MNEESFWNGYARMMKLLEALGLVLLVFGPIAGLVLFFLGDWGMRLVGIFVIVMSAFLSLYHFSFAYVMSALRQSCGKKNEAVQASS